MNDELIAGALDIARCSQINFDNLARAVPALQAHPMYIIARGQLDSAVEILEGDSN